MSYVKNLKPVLAAQPQILTIGLHSSLAQTFKKIKKNKYLDFVFLPKPNSRQMAGTLLARLSGKKFFWIQGFENPPVPTFFERLLLSQADRVLVRDKKYFLKLKKMGVDPHRIRLSRLGFTLGPSKTSGRVLQLQSQASTQRKSD